MVIDVTEGIQGLLPPDLLSLHSLSHQHVKSVFTLLSSGKKESFPWIIDKVYSPVKVLDNLGINYTGIDPGIHSHRGGIYNELSPDLFQLGVGDYIQLTGRVQSREYKRMVEEEFLETKIAYEISINELLIDKDNNNKRI